MCIRDRTEGVAKMLLGMLKQMFLANLGGKLAYLLLKGSVADLKHQMDSEEYGLSLIHI